jgi:L-amino acid N-acyltransferase YncA
MLVRLAIEGDRPELLAMCSAAVRESVRGIEPELPVIDETISAYFASADPTFFVVEGPGRHLIGFMMATIGGYSFASGIYTTQQVMYVKPENRGSRAATLLIQNLIDWSRLVGAREITGGNNNGLYTAQTERLLTKHGFQPVGTFMRREVG